jgi:fructokinase
MKFIAEKTNTKQVVTKGNSWAVLYYNDKFYYNMVILKVVDTVGAGSFLASIDIRLFREMSPKDTELCLRWEL